MNCRRKTVRLSLLTGPEDGVDKQKKSCCIYIVILLQVELYYKQIVNEPVCGSRYSSNPKNPKILLFTVPG